MFDVIAGPFSYFSSLEIIPLIYVGIVVCTHHPLQE